MRQLKGFKLSDHTTLRVGGLATTVCEIQSPSDIQDFVHEYGCLLYTSDAADE